MDVFPIDYTTLESDIVSLTGSRVDDQSWLIALFETGGLLIDDDDHDVRRPIGEELRIPSRNVSAWEDELSSPEEARCKRMKLSNHGPFSLVWFWFLP